MHAVVVTAKIGPDQFEAARKSLHETVVPRVSKAPGVVKAFWSISADHMNGLSMIVFKTQQDAQNAADMVRNTPPPTGVTLANVEVREIVAEV